MDLRAKGKLSNVTPGHPDRLSSQLRGQDPVAKVTNQTPWFIAEDLILSVQGLVDAEVYII